MAWICLRIARLLGWTFEGSLPPEPSMVIVAYPHTSNWDFPVFLAALAHFHLDVRFLAAQGLFVGPFGWFLRRIGGIPVDQRAPQAAVRAAVDEFDRADEMVLVVAPEGTRAAVSSWRSGFWRIADAADVPVVMGSLDGVERRLVLGPAMRIAGDPHGWMDAARVFYAGATGLRPSNAGPVRLATEIPEPGEPAA
jgi:1-acyl-sn-glycerol-3-phosphate acyltransferase